jgi:hypothetical protein
MKIKDWNRFIESIENNFREDFEKVRELCGPFLHEMGNMKGDPDILFRGMRNHVYNIGLGNNIRGEKLTEHVFKYPSRKDRIPTDTNKILTDIMDKYSLDKFGFRMRSEGTFATKRSEVAVDYGGSFAFFPIGNYNYVWSYLVDDFYVYVSDLDWYPNRFTIEEYEKGYGLKFNEKDWFNRPEVQSEIKKYLDNYIEGGPDNSTMGEVSKEEISFNCEEYLVLDLDYHYVCDEFGFTKYRHDE